MKRHIKYKQLFLGLAAFLLLAAGNLAIPVAANALPPTDHFAASSDPCPGDPVPLKVDKKWQKDGTTCCPPGTNTNTNTCLFGKYINPLIALLSALVGVVVVMAIIVGGIQYSSSAGDPQRAAAGKKHIINALIGLLAYLFLYAFLQFIVPGGRLNG